MADNPQKRMIVNRALAILCAGRTSGTGLFFTSITDEQFADWTTIPETSSVSIDGEPDKRMAVMLYEPILKQVLLDMQPQFACDYADLGQSRKVNHADGGWSYLFELPTDFLGLVAQVNEDNPGEPPVLDRDPELLHFKGYAHTVEGTDGNVYYCKVNHTSADANEPITGASYATNWTLDATDALTGAEWASGVAYKASGTGSLLATDTLTNAAGTSAYIKYIAYVQTTNAGVAGRSDQPAYYPESFKAAFATRLAAEMAQDTKDYERRVQLLQEYEVMAKPEHWRQETRHRGRTRALTVFERRTSY
jgi:hypothetical protein